MEQWTAIDSKTKFGADALGLDGVTIFSTSRDTYGNLTKIVLQDEAGHKAAVSSKGYSDNIQISKPTAAESAQDEAAA